MEELHHRLGMTPAEAREVIRRHDPLLALRCDLVYPITEIDKVYRRVLCTQAEYDAEEFKDPGTVYVIY